LGEVVHRLAGVGGSVQTGPQVSWMGVGMYSG
jgi:hypothetical protein